VPAPGVPGGAADRTGGPRRLETLDSVLGARVGSAERRDDVATFVLQPVRRPWGASEVVARPRLALPLVAVAAAQVAASAAGIGWACPLHALTGVPCPGCGLSRASVALLRGEWGESLRLHALAPIFLLVVLARAVVVVLPARMRERAARLAQRLESRRAIPLAALSVLIGYWLLRLALGWRG
jgi:hypothetical protein